MYTSFLIRMKKKSKLVRYDCQKLSDYYSFLKLLLFNRYVEFDFVVTLGQASILS